MGYNSEDDTCSCCDCYLNEAEIQYGDDLCFPCIKGNCPNCGDEDG